MIEIVRGLPVIEHLVTVLDGREERSEQAGRKEDVECDDGLQAFSIAGLPAPENLSTS